MKSFKILVFILLSLFGAVRIFGESLERHGLGVSLSPGWLPLDIGDGCNGVAGYCDSGQVSFIIDKKPFDLKPMLGSLDEEIVSGMMKTELNALAGFRGHGFRKSGKDKDGDGMSYTLFFPDKPWSNVVILLTVVGTPAQGRLTELNGILSTLHEVPLPKNPAGNP